MSSDHSQKGLYICTYVSWSYHNCRLVLSSGLFREIVLSSGPFREIVTPNFIGEMVTKQYFLSCDFQGNSQPLSCDL